MTKQIIALDRILIETEIVGRERIDVAVEL
jgi:hypothetical protein